MEPNVFYMAGLDIGQAADYTALAIIEMRQYWVLHADRSKEIPTGVDYYCRHLERFPLGTPYPAIVEQVKERLLAPELRGNCGLIVDATGVGAPIVDLVRKGGLRCIAITIHGGENVVKVSGGYRVPKRDLVGTAQVLLQEERLKFAADMPEVPTLVNELTKFEYKLTTAGHDTYGAWREGAHDDLVFAVALAVWFCEDAPIERVEVGFLPRYRIGPDF